MYSQDRKIFKEQLTGSFCLDGKSHHWVIDPPGGTTLLGYCKNCKEERDFYIPDESIPVTKEDKVLYTNVLSLAEIED